MKTCRWLGTCLVMAALAHPAGAGWFFHKHAKVNPAERVPSLIALLRTDPDAHQREAAAEELRNYDAGAYPDMLPALIHAAQEDASPSVRLEALQTLEKLRPVSQQVGMVLEQAMANDASTRVRLQARTLLWQYHLSGYHSAKVTEAPPAKVVPKTSEPPLAPPLPEPPLGSPSLPSAQAAPSLPAPMPSVPVLVPAPSLPSPLPSRAPPVPSGDGPELTVPR